MEDELISLQEEAGLAASSGWFCGISDPEPRLSSATAVEGKSGEASSMLPAESGSQRRGIDEAKIEYPGGGPTKCRNSSCQRALNL